MEFDQEELGQGADSPLGQGKLAAKISRALAGCSSIRLLYLDAQTSQEDFSTLQAGLQVASERIEVVAWPPTSDAPATVAVLFAHCFWTLMLGYSCLPSEAFAVARNVSLALASTGTPPQPPRLPTFLSTTGTEPALPSYFSVPSLQRPGLQAGLQQDLTEAIPGWRNLWLMAPRSELFFSLCGGPGLLEVSRLSDLGEALRALLVLEVSGQPYTAKPLNPLTFTPIETGWRFAFAVQYLKFSRLVMERPWGIPILPCLP